MKFSSRMKHERLWIAVITLLFVILGVVYSLATPIFEASDELWHYPVVKHIADGRGLPVQQPGVEALWQQEGSQPPAYYALAALVTAWIDTDDLSEVRWLNPLANTGKPLAAGNKNLVIHTEARGVSLARVCSGGPSHSVPICVAGCLCRLPDLSVGPGGFAAAQRSGVGRRRAGGVQPHVSLHLRVGEQRQPHRASGDTHPLAGGADATARLAEQWPRRFVGPPAWGWRL